MKRIPHKQRIREIIKGMQRRNRRKQREIDVEILWPACKDLVGDADAARRAFLVHALGEHCWTADLTDAEIVAEVDRLK